MTSRAAAPRFGLWLVLIGVGMAGGALYGTWKHREPSRRYSGICSLLRENRGKRGAEWSKDDRKALWDGIQWFEKRSPEQLTAFIAASIATAPADEREDAVALAVTLSEFDGELDSNSTVTGPVPAPHYAHSTMAFKLDRLPDDHAEAFARLASDEHRTVRQGFLNLLGWANPTAFRPAVAKMVLQDPDPGIRLEAMRLGWYHLPGPDRLSIGRRLAQDPDPAIRLMAHSRLAADGDAQAFKTCVELVTDPDRTYPSWEREFCINDLARWGALQSRCADTLAAFKGPREKMLVVAAEWKSWFKTKEFEEFAVELSKVR